MSASEKSGQNQFPWTGPYAVPDYPDMEERYDPGKAETAVTYAPEAAGIHACTGELRVLPAPLPEESRTAVQAARGAGNTLWTTVRAHKAVTAGAAVGTAAALTLAYTLGRRTRRRGLGPVARLLEHRF
ncbi:hypothetical protein [Streptomyces zaomyceticus]|uniref:hypothetical protein n=1 Tax=Streptomyces zaomyceticus TaxID=68286 RepID=UPI002E0D6943|nr:hypothetical protein OG237_01540 [Streptomyces zaomyceticus]